ERLLAAREQVHADELLSRRLGDDLHARLGGRIGWILDELQLGVAAAEQPREDLLETLVDQRERLAESLLAGPIDALDCRPQLAQRILQVLLLPGEEGEPIADLFRFVDGRE